METEESPLTLDTAISTRRRLGDIDDDASGHLLLDEEEEDGRAHAHHVPHFPSASLLRSNVNADITTIPRAELNNMVKAVNGHSAGRIYEMESFLQDSMRSEIKLLALSQKNKNGVTALFWAIRNRVHCSIIKDMLDIGGKDFVMQTNPLGENSLHYAAFCGASYDVFEALVEVGGKDALLVQDRLGNTPLHYAYCWVVSNRTKMYLTKKGGREALLAENKKSHVPFLKSSIRSSSGEEGRRVPKLGETILNIGGDDYYVHNTQSQDLKNLNMIELLMLNQLQEIRRRLSDVNWDSAELLSYDGTSRKLNCLMIAVWFHGNAEPRFKEDLISIIKQMIEVGGKQLVLMENDSGSNALHYATFNQMPLEVIQLLVETAGTQIIHQKNEGWSNTPLHDACLRQAPEEVIKYLVKNQEGTKALLALNNDRKTPLDVLLNEDKPSESRIMALQCAWYEKDKYFAQTLKGDVIMKTLLWEFDKGDDSHVLSNSFIKAILNDMFIQNRYRVVVMTDLYVQIAIITVYSLLGCSELYSSNPDSNSPCIRKIAAAVSILAICAGYLCCREVIQILSSKMERYVTGYDNYVQLCQIVFVIWSVILLDSEFRVDDLDQFRYVMIGATSISWLKLLFVIGQLNFSVSVFTSALVQIIVELFPFALTSALVIASFAQMYYIAGVGTPNCDTDDNHFNCSRMGSFFQSFAMLLSTEFQFLDWDEVKKDKLGRQQILVSICFALIVGILLLNILIGVVSNVFEEVTAKSENTFWSTRLSFMVEISVIRDALDADQIDLRKLVSMTSYDEQEDNTKVPHIGRISFAQYDDNWMRTKCPDAHVEAFFKWWYYPWRLSPPSISTRLGYFYKYASPREIILPGQVFINVLFGCKYDHQWKSRTRLPFALAISYIHFLVGIVIIMVIFLLGLCSFGCLWPKAMKKYLFFGPVEMAVKEGKANSSMEVHNLKMEINDMKHQNVDLMNKVNETQKQLDEIQEQNAKMLVILAKIQRDSSLIGGFN